MPYLIPKVFGFSLMILTMSVFRSSAFGDGCDAILRHGIRNIEISQSTTAAMATKYANNCSKDFSQLDEASLTTAEVQIFGFGGGGVGVSHSQREQRLRDACSQMQESFRNNASLYHELQTLYAPAFETWRQCKELDKYGVRFDPTIDEGNQWLTVALHYTGPTRSGILFYGTDADGFAVLNADSPKITARLPQLTVRG